MRRGELCDVGGHGKVGVRRVVRGAAMVAEVLGGKRGENGLKRVYGSERGSYEGVDFFAEVLG